MATLAAKKKQARKAVPVVAKAVEQVSQIRVRATKTGYAGDLLRNPGEVFLLDTRVLEKAPTADELKTTSHAMRARLETFDTVEVEGVEYLLPSWVTLADEEETEPKGHAASQASGPSQSPMSVL